MEEINLQKTIKPSEALTTDQLLQNFSQNLDLSPAHRQKLARIAQEIRASKNRIQNTFISSSMEHYVQHLKNLTNDQLNRVDSDDIDQTTGRPKSVEKYIQKAMERRQRVKQNTIRTSSIDPGSRSEIMMIGRRVQDSSNTPIVSGSIQETVPSLAYQLRLEQNDPLLRLHLPQQSNKYCPTVAAAERVLAQHREWMDERRQQRQKEEEEENKSRIKRYKIDDINDLQHPHAEDCYVYQQARNVVSAANELQRAKMFRITRNSSSGSSPPTISASSYLSGIRNNSTYMQQYRESQASQLQNQGIASLLAAREGLTPFQPAISSPTSAAKTQLHDQEEVIQRQQISQLTPSRRLMQASSSNLEEITQGQAKSQEGSYDIDQNELRYFSGRYSQILNSFAQIVSQLQDTLSDDLSKIKQPLEEFKRLSTVKAYPKTVIRYLNSTFLKIEKPPKGTKRKIWNFLKATIIYMIEKIKNSRVSNSTSSNRSLSKRHAARVMRQIKRGQSGGQRRSLLSESTLSRDQSSINQNMFQMLTPSQQQMLLRHKHNFVMDVKPKTSKLHQNKKYRMKFSELTKQQSGNYGGSLIDDNSHQGSGFGSSSSQFFTGHRSAGGRVSSLNFQPRTSTVNIQGLNATSEDSLSLSNANVQQQFAPAIGKKHDNKGSPKILQPKFIGQALSRSKSKRDKDREQFQGTQIQTAGWADSQQSPQIQTPQSLMKSRSGEGSIFKNQDVYLYKDGKELSDSKKNYLVVQIKQDKTQQRSPTAQLINLKTARAQAKRQLSKIGAMEDYNVVPVTKIVQSKERKSSLTKSGGSFGASPPNSKIIRRLKKYSPVRGDNLIKSLREIQKLESPQPRRSSSISKRLMKSSSQSKMKKINQQNQADATPPNQLQNRNLVEEFKAVAQDITEQQKIDRLIAQNQRYLQEQQREENQIKLRLEQKFSQIKEEILEQQNSPQIVRKIEQSMGQQEAAQQSQPEPRIKLAAAPPALIIKNRIQVLPVQINTCKEKKSIVEDPVFEPAKEIIQEIALYQPSYQSKYKKQEESKSKEQIDQSEVHDKQYLPCPYPLKIEDLQVSQDSINSQEISNVSIRITKPKSISPKNFLLLDRIQSSKNEELQISRNSDKSDHISTVEIKISRPRSASPKNFLLMNDDDQQAFVSPHDLPKKIETPKNKKLQQKIEEVFQETKQQDDLNIQKRILSPHSQKINQYKRIIQINQREPATPPVKHRPRYQLLFKNYEEQQQSNVFGQRKESSSSVVRQQTTQDIIERIRSARDARNQVKNLITSIAKPALYSESIQVLNESRFQRSKTPSMMRDEEQRLDPDLQRSLRQISRKSIVLKNADIIKNQYQVDEQKHLQELQKTLCARQPAPEADQTHEFLQTSQTSSTNKNRSSNLRDSLLTLNQLSVEKQTPTSAAYYYKRHMNPGRVKSDTADPTASFGLGASRISDQISNMPRKMVAGDTIILGQEDMSLAQQNLQLRSAFKQKLKGSGDKKRLTQEISQACYKEVEKLIQQERREDQLRGMRKKSKYIEVKSKVKDYIQGRSFSRQYQKISDISALTQNSSMRKTPVQESASKLGSSSRAANIHRSKSPKIVRQFHLSSTAAISSPNSARRLSKKANVGSIGCQKIQEAPVIEQKEKIDSQEQLKDDFQILNEKQTQNDVAAQSHHASGEILLPTIYTSTQNQSPRHQGSNPSSSSRRHKAQQKKKLAGSKQVEKESIDILKVSPVQRSNKYLYQQLNTQYKTQQDYKRQERDYKKQSLLQKIEKISNEIKEKTNDSILQSQLPTFLAESFSYQSLKKNSVRKENTKFKGKVGSRLIAHTQTSRAKVINRQENKKPIVPRIKGMRIDGDSNKYALHTSYNSAPSSARMTHKKSSSGLNYFNSKSTLTKRDQGNWQINTHNRQLLSPELIQNLTLQSSMYREEQTPVFESSINATPTASSICTPRGTATTKLSKKQPHAITKVKKIQQFSSRPVNLNIRTQQTLSPSASSITASKNGKYQYNSASSSSFASKQKSRSTPKLQGITTSQNSNQQQFAYQNPRNNNQSNSNYRNRQPMQRKVTITTTTTTQSSSNNSRPQTTRNSSKKSTFTTSSKAFGGLRRSQDDIFKQQGHAKIAHTPRNQNSSRQVFVNQESKTEFEGSGSKNIKKKWLSKQMEREKQKMAKSYHKIISTSSGMSSKSMTSQQWNRLKAANPVQVIYESTQQSV